MRPTRCQIGSLKASYPEGPRFCRPTSPQHYWPSPFLILGASRAQILEADGPRCCWLHPVGSLKPPQLQTPILIHAGLRLSRPTLVNVLLALLKSETFSASPFRGRQPAPARSSPPRRPGCGQTEGFPAAARCRQSAVLEAPVRRQARQRHRPALGAPLRHQRWAGCDRPWLHFSEGVRHAGQATSRMVSAWPEAKTLPHGHQA